jgi:hypothetical protein
LSYSLLMTKEALQLMAEALKRVTVAGDFSPAEIGAKIGLNRSQSEAAARALSNAGVLVLGFDCAAHFTPEFRKANPLARNAARDRARNGARHEVRNTASRVARARK